MQLTVINSLISIVLKGCVNKARVKIARVKNVNINNDFVKTNALVNFLVLFNKNCYSTFGDTVILLFRI